MLWLPVLFVASMMFLVVAAFALMFWSVAFAGFGGAARPSEGWELPMLSSERVRSWAANLARRVVARHACQARSAETPLSIATELEAGANAVLEQTAERIHSEVAKTCPDARPRRIGVTAPEVFAISAELERRYPRSELQIIREVAVLNSRRTRFVLPEEYPQAGITCPLRTHDGHCLTFTSRPIACRRLCGSCPGCGEACATETDSPTSVTEHLHDGLSNGLTEGLRLAGLDDGVYELNDALVVALTTPQAASRWSRGEAVFSGCMKT